MKTYEEAKGEMHPEEITLNELMREYRGITNELNSACHLIDIEIENLQEHRNDVARPYQEKLAELEAQMRIPMLDRQSSFICSFGKINFRKGTVRRTWNLDALDQISYADAYIKDKIWAFRTESIGDPSITVKLAEAQP